MARCIYNGLGHLTRNFPCRFASIVMKAGINPSVENMEVCKPKISLKEEVENSQLFKLTVLIQFLGGIFACAFVKPLVCPGRRNIQNTDTRKRLESALIQCVSGDCLSSSDSQNGCRFHNRRTHPQRT